MENSKTEARARVAEAMALKGNHTIIVRVRVRAWKTDVDEV